MVDEETRKRMQRGWSKGETPCGAGSRLDTTRELVKWLPTLFQDYRINSFCDLGAGDLHWMSEVVLPKHLAHSYYDLVPRAPGVHRLDITERCPKADLLICRMVLIHLNKEYVQQAVDNMRASGSKYLLATTWDRTDNDKVDWNAAYHRINMDTVLDRGQLVSIPDGSGRHARCALYSL